MARRQGRGRERTPTATRRPGARASASRWREGEGGASSKPGARALVRHGREISRVRASSVCSKRYEGELVWNGHVQRLDVCAGMVFRVVCNNETALERCLSRPIARPARAPAARAAAFGYRAAALLCIRCRTGESSNGGLRNEYHRTGPAFTSEGGDRQIRLMTNSHKSQSEKLAAGGGRETTAKKPYNNEVPGPHY
jgi:hypothetical protein